VGRVYPIFTPDAFLVIAYIGLFTLFITGTIALTATDIKKVLAYSTCSQLGYMILGLGVGGFTAGLAHLTTHAAFKACLFLGSGSVIHAVHSQEITEMGGLRKKMPITFVTFLIATLSISGVPFFSGFYSKDMILKSALLFGMKNPHHMILFAGALLTAGMTAYYMFRLVIRTFLGEPVDHHKFDHAHESPPNMWVPLVVLAGLSFSFWYSGWFGDLVTRPASAIPAAHAVADSRGTADHILRLPAAGAAFAAESAGPMGAGRDSVPSTASEGHGKAGQSPSAPHGEAHAPAVPHGTGHGVEAGGHDASHEAHLDHLAHVWSMYLSVLFGTLGIGLAFVVFRFRWINPEKVASAIRPLHTFLVNKWYFDELYEATAVNGTKALSRALGWFDLHVVDGLVNLCAHLGVWFSYLTGKFDNAVVDGAVNGVADVTIGSGSFFRRFQTGKLYHYVFILAGGVLIIYLIKAF
jgi:NADH-quinone oxidoreductase subunit L